MLKNILIKLAGQFKRFPYFGRQRFWFLYWSYRITGWHIRHKEWDFVLDYLPPLMEGQNVKVLDVGCSRNLFCHEVVARGYKLTGIDLEEPSFKYPGWYCQTDIRTFIVPSDIGWDFVTCISVLEHIEGENARGMALYNMVKSLKLGGRLLITIPTKEFAQGHPWEGFDWNYFSRIRPQGMNILEYTERAGQICMAIERVE